MRFFLYPVTEHYYTVGQMFAMFDSPPGTVKTSDPNIRSNAKSHGVFEPFGNAETDTADNWLRSFSFAWNQLI